MPTARRARSSREKVEAHRRRLRKQGLRPVQLWVPDVRYEAFAAEAHRQSLAVARSRHAAEDQAFVDAISEWNDAVSEASCGPRPAGRLTRAGVDRSSFCKTVDSTRPDR